MRKDISTEEKIKEAAREIFQEKGYGLARTRDIAERAGINLALLNYYFRSKKKLYEIIMQESMEELFAFFLSIINNPKITLANKIDRVVDGYINDLLKHPNLPLFVFSELQTNPERLMGKIHSNASLIKNSVFYKEIAEQLVKENLIINPLNIFINILSLSIFPIMAKSLIEKIGVMDENDFLSFINERKKLIPLWIKSTLKIEN